MIYLQQKGIYELFKADPNLDLSQWAFQRYALFNFFIFILLYLFLVMRLLSNIFFFNGSMAQEKSDSVDPIARLVEFYGELLFCA